jgi:NAD(P)-dependent dehydrogenase (short-subunit alcohol dehydrogenase family)
MAWTARDIPDLTGAVAVVTGASGGLGLETTRALAGAGAEVVMVARDAARTYAAAARIHETDPDASLAILPVNLSSLNSVGVAARTLLASHERVDILVNNAGVMAIPWQRTADGFEMQIGVNHLGHFALTARLLPALLRAPAARVVSVTSTAHHLGRALGPGVSSPGRYHPWRAYGWSKLANLHFALGLHRLFTTAGVRAASLVADPGLSHTGLQEESARSSGGGRSQRLFAFLAAHAGMTPEQAALPQLRAATDPAARSGEFYAPLLVAGGPPVCRPVLRAGLDQAIRRLWTESERATGLTLDIGTLRRAARV